MENSILELKKDKENLQNEIAKKINDFLFKYKECPIIINSIDFDSIMFCDDNTETITDINIKISLE